LCAAGKCNRFELWVRHPEDARRDDDEQFGLHSFDIAAAKQGSYPGDLANAGNARQRFGLRFGEIADHHGRLAIFQRDDTLVFLIVDDGNAVVRSCPEGANLHFEVETDVAVRLNGGSGLYREAKVFIVERRERGDVAPVPNYVGDGSGVVDGRERAVEDRIALANTDGGRGILLRAQGEVIQRLQIALVDVEVQRGAGNGERHQSQTTTVGGKRIGEKGRALRAERLCEECLDAFAVRLVNRPGGDEIVDQRIEIRRSELRKRRAERERSELLWGLNPELAGKIAAHLVNMNVDSNLWPRVIEIVEEAGDRLDRLGRCTHRDGILRRLRHDEANVKDHSEHIDDVLDLGWRGGFGKIKR